MKTYIGVDPGKTGCVSIMHLFDESFDVGVTFIDAENLDFFELGKILINEKQVFVLLEKVQVMPGSKQRRMAAGISEGGQPGEEKEVGQGRVGILNYGIGYGEYLGLLKTLRIPYSEIHPATWKAAFSLFHQPKERSIAVAKQLFPSIANQLTRKKDHGRAESLLIAEFARRRNM